MFKRKLISMAVIVCMIATSGVPVMAESLTDVDEPIKVEFTNVGNTHTIKEKEKLKLKIGGMPRDEKIVYKTSNKKIATVSETGVIKGIKKGKIIVKAIYKNNDELIDSVKITVGTKIKKIEWSGSNTVYMGRTMDLKVKTVPSNASNKAMVFEGDNDTVAKVSKDGDVTPIQNGTLNVKATSLDGSNKTISQQVTVKTFVSELEVKPEVSLKYGFFKDETFKIKTISVGPSDATDKTILFRTTTPKVLSVSKRGNVRPIGPGTGVVKVDSADGHFTKSYTVKVHKNLKMDGSSFVAHRGLSGEYPENTAESIKAASKAGIGAIETDIWTIRDAQGNMQFICNHDKNLSRTTGYDIPATEVVYENLKTDFRYNIRNKTNPEDNTDYKIPTIEEAMTASEDKTLLIEIKEDDFSVEQSKELIKKVQLQKPLNKVKFISFRRSSLSNIKQAAREMGVNITTGINLSRTAYREGLTGHFDWAKANGIDNINLNYKYTTKEIVDEVHKKYKLTIHAGTTDDPRVAAYLLEIGADSVTSNVQVYNMK